MNLETTCRIPRDELLGLLNTMTPIEQQRITAEFAAVSPPADLVITFKQPKSKLPRMRIAVISASFCVSFALGIIAAAML